MVARFMLTAIGIVLAVISLRRVWQGLREEAGRVPFARDHRGPLVVGQLREDPETGVYYPAD
jgi:hypothetical protein